LSFKDLPEGNYDAQLFAKNGYCHIGSKISFSVTNAGTGDGTGGGTGGGAASITVGKPSYKVGETVSVNYSNSASSRDWIAVYPQGSIGKSCEQNSRYVAWKYAENSSGSVSFSNLGAGNYQLQMFQNDGYCHLGSPVPFSISAGSSTGGFARVAFVGDSGYGSNFQSVLNLIKAEGAGMTMFVGDTAYGSGYP
jgi:hypothetical protein